MTETDDQTGANPLNDPEFYDAVRSQFIELFLEPELERRQLQGTEVHQFAAILSPGGGVRVLINDEVTWVAQAGVNRAIQKGETVTTADFDVASIGAMRPAAAGPDDAWAALVDLESHRLLTFNFQRNRGKARTRLDLADEFHAAALPSIEAGRIGPATENLFAAAELAVKAGMLLIDDNPTRVHHKREQHFISWAELGNAPMSQADTLRSLRAARPSARYGDEGPRLSLDELRTYADEVRAMIEMVRAQASHPLD
jgi:hypothetical protein